MRVDKLPVVKKGIFLVRFEAMDSRDNVFAGNYFFDKKASYYETMES